MSTLHKLRKDDSCVPVAKPQTLLQGKPWRPAFSGSVQDTWRKYGWTPRDPESNRISSPAVISYERKVGQ